MNRRELILSDKPLLPTTKEDIILKSPFRIPPKGVQDIINLRGITSLDTAYYDISPTENQYIIYKQVINDLHFNTQNQLPIELYNIQNLKMGWI